MDEPACSETAASSEIAMVEIAYFRSGENYRRAMEV
jgi:hypothetical protein